MGAPGTKRLARVLVWCSPCVRLSNASIHTHTHSLSLSLYLCLIRMYVPYIYSRTMISEIEVNVSRLGQSEDPYWKYCVAMPRYRHAYMHTYMRTYVRTYIYIYIYVKKIDSILAHHWADGQRERDLGCLIHLPFTPWHALHTPLSCALLVSCGSEGHGLQSACRHPRLHRGVPLIPPLPLLLSYMPSHSLSFAVPLLFLVSVQIFCIITFHCITLFFLKGRKGGNRSRDRILCCRGSW